MAADQVSVENFTSFDTANTITVTGDGQFMIDNLVGQASSFLTYKIGKLLCIFKDIKS